MCRGMRRLLGAPARDLRERLLELPTPGVRFHLLERAFLSPAVRPLEVRAAIAYTLDTLDAHVAHLRALTPLSRGRAVGCSC
jgi:hypothetical protein